jgi:hypothetical protein
MDAPPAEQGALFPQHTTSIEENQVCQGEQHTIVIEENKTGQGE